MASENEQEDVVDEDLSKLDDSTDWKAKAQELEQKRREDGIRSRERTKALKEQIEAQKAKAPEIEKSDDTKLLAKLERLSLRTAGITADDEAELARTTAKKWGVDIDEVIGDDDFKIKLEKLRTSKANLDATSNIKGSGDTSNAKNTPAYWIAKGTPPTADQVPDRKTRASIVRAMMATGKSGGKKFYSD